MELTIEKGLNLETVYNFVKGQSLPIKTMYKLSKLFQALGQELQPCYESFQALSDKYGEKDSEGRLMPGDTVLGVTIRQDGLEDCEKEFKDLMEMKINLPEIYFSLEELNDLNLPLNKFNFLLPFIEDEV